MITWKGFRTDKSQRKKLIILILLSNIGAILLASYWLYFREALFDTSKRPAIDSKEISKIEIREGSWKWSDKEWAFGHDTKVILANRQEIENFCSVVKSSPAKYIDNMRPIHWLYIYITKNGRERLSIELKNNYQKETFFEYGNHTYDGTQLAEQLRELQ